MQIKEYFKGVAYAAFQPVIKSLSAGFPAYGAGFSMLTDRTFVFDLNGKSAYNNKIFYAAQNILVRKLVEAPIIFSTIKPNSAKKLNKFYSKSISNENRKLIKAQALTEVENHDLNRLFDNPNDYQSGIELREDFWYNYGTGDGFLWFERLGDAMTRNNRPIHIHSLNRNRVEVITSNDRLNPVLGYRFTTWNGQTIEIPKEDMLHLRHWNPNLGDLKGLGVDVVASADISINYANNMAQGALYKNGGRGTVVSGKSEVTSEGTVVSKLAKEQALAIKETMQRDWTGAHNQGRMTFTNGEVVITPYGDSMTDLDAIAGENASWKSIFAIVGIPVALAPITEAATENNVKTGYKALVTNLVVSELRKFDQKLTQKVQQWWPEIIACHDLTEFSELAPDLELMAKVFNPSTGIALRNDERRSVFNWDELGGEEGRAILLPSGLVQLSDLLSGELDVDPSAEEL